MPSYYQFLDRQEQADGSIIARYMSTIHAQGAWNEHEQHMAPATGIISHELQHFSPRTDMRIARISLDIFGLIHAGEFEITTHTIRAGRTIELIESVMTAKGKVSITARAWRLQMSDTSAVAGLEDTPVAISDNRWPMDVQWAGGFIRSVEACTDDRRAGSGVVWLSNDLEMVEGVPTTDFVRLMGMVDAANGVVPRIEQQTIEWLFPNLDLQIHLYRLPVGKRLGLQSIQQIGDDGIGLTSSILHDELGPFGRSEQILTVRQLHG
ncbi:thioesterase family protein [Moraxella sp. FZFQ2102]|uniref:thioesterase family protein n=1 Tax=Moraxella sp. FZFQ2102 TaxID=2953752 RepID=UPI00209BBD49|nr:thioesterase family protein [Moraxella sp. FZFQ2102]USZ15314.1 thioesterase family protein [Moraxella sp. FZFQ2102]